MPELLPIPLCLPLTCSFTSKSWFGFFCASLVSWELLSWNKRVHNVSEAPPERFIIILLGRARSRSQIASIAASIELIFSALQFLYYAIIKLPLSLLSSASSISLCQMGAAAGLGENALPRLDWISLPQKLEEFSPK